MLLPSVVSWWEGVPGQGHRRAKWDGMECEETSKQAKKCWVACCWTLLKGLVESPGSFFHDRAQTNSLNHVPRQAVVAGHTTAEEISSKTKVKFLSKTRPPLAFLLRAMRVPGRKSPDVDSNARRERKRKEKKLSGTTERGAARPARLRFPPSGLRAGGGPSLSSWLCALSVVFFALLSLAPFLIKEAARWPGARPSEAQGLGS